MEYLLKIGIFYMCYTNLSINLCGFVFLTMALSIGERHPKARSDGGNCNADTTEAFGTRELERLYLHS